jgi:hypothetical protein
MERKKTFNTGILIPQEERKLHEKIIISWLWDRKKLKSAKPLLFNSLSLSLSLCFFFFPKIERRFKKNKSKQNENKHLTEYMGPYKIYILKI